MNSITSDLPVYHGHWLWKSTFELGRHPVQFFDKLSARLGDTFYARLPFPVNFVLTSSPGLIRHVLQTHQKNYEKDKGYDQLALLLGKGLVTSRGEFWRKQRKIAQPAFYKTQLQKLYREMQMVAGRYMEHLRTKSGELLDISREMMAVTAKIAMKALFSKELEGDLLNIYECISYSQHYVTRRSMLPFYAPLAYLNGAHRKFLRQKRVMDELIYDLIAERKQMTGTQHDFLQMLLDARYEDTGEPMSEEQLRDELVTIFSAGHETSSNALAWSCYLLSQYPQVLQKVRQENSQVVGEGLPSFEQLPKLVYTRQVIEECMRLFPPVWGVGRYALSDDEWEGHPIKADTIILMMIHGLHRHPAIWPDPERFDPDRFHVETAKSRPKFHYLPFGAGPRMCIGNHFAMMEMQLLLSMLVTVFDFELIPGQRIQTEPLVTLRPKYGIQLRLHSRS